MKNNKARDIQKHIDKFEAASNEIQQQHEEVLKSLEATKDKRVESVNSIKQQQIDAICDVVAQRIQTAKDTTEANNDGLIDLETNQFIERQQQQRDTEILLYTAEYDKEDEAAWEALEAYVKYAKVADATIIRRIEARIATLENIEKAVQAATEKRKIALLQKAFANLASTCLLFFFF